MNNPLRISRTLVKRLAKVSNKARVSPRALVETALSNQLDYEEWFLKAVDEGLADLDAGRIYSTREVTAALDRQRANRGRGRRKSAA